MAFDAEFARSQRLPVITVEYLMMAFIALTIVACLRMVGIVLVISLLTIPQVTANIFTHSFKRMALLSIVTGYSGCLGGLYLSYHYNIPSGASIISSPYSSIWCAKEFHGRLFDGKGNKIHVFSYLTV